MARATSPLQPQNWLIEQLPGLSDKDAEILQGCGIETTFQLLQQMRSPQRFEAFVAALKLHIKYARKWIALADLARVPSVGCDYCGLLLHAGIGSTAQLAQASVHRLHPQLLRLQVTTIQRRDRCPTAKQVTEWIYQARQMPPL